MMREFASKKPKAKESKAGLMSQHPHYPTRYEDSANEHGKTVQAIANLFSGSTTLGDTEHH
jgi:hypothetical protein